MSSDVPFNLLKNLIDNSSNNAKIKEKIDGWNKAFQFNPVDADPFFIEISNNEINVSQGTHDSPLATMIAETQDLIDMLEGKLDSLGAFFSGKLKIEGKVMETQSLNFILKEAISSSS